MPHFLPRFGVCQPLPCSKKAPPLRPCKSIKTGIQPHQRPNRRRRILPGFHLTLGFTIFYLSGIVLIPLAALVLKTVTPTTDYPSITAVVGHVVRVATDERALDSYRLSFGLSFAAALLNGFFGFIAAWALTRYQFPGRKIIDALVDLPFAMPTSVAGLALTQVFSTNGGYIGQVLYEWFGWRIAYTSWGILIALTFIGFPFVVRTLQAGAGRSRRRGGRSRRVPRREPVAKPFAALSSPRSARR